MRLASSMAVIASLDYGWQFWKTKRDLMMTRQALMAYSLGLLGLSLPKLLQASSQYTGPKPPYQHLDVDKKYSWLKTPRWKGHAMEVGPLARYVLGEELHSHILLIPFVSWYLANLDRDRWPAAGPGSPRAALLFAIPGAALLALALMRRTGGGALSHNDYLAAAVGGGLCFLWAGGFLLLGRKRMAAVAFPAAFLLFMIPLPDAVVSTIEHTLVAATSEVVDLFFLLTGVSFLRDANVFQLAGITLQVAQECSGIRSSLVLFITGLVAAPIYYAYVKDELRDKGLI